MIRVLVVILTMAAGTFAAMVLGGAAGAQGRYAAQLSGWNQAPPISTEAVGRVEVAASHDLTFHVSYGKLHGDALAVSVHLGHPGAVGGPVLILCGGSGSGQKACPAAPAEFEVVVQPGDVLAVPAQGVEAKDLEPVVAALDEGLLYVSVASKDFPTGEIRGQLSRGKDKEKD